MSHYSLKTSIQKNSPCFLFNPSCDDIIIRKGINRIETLYKHTNHQFKCSQVQFYNLVFMKVKVEKVFLSFTNPII